MEKNNMEDTIYAPTKRRKRKIRIVNKKRFVLCIITAVVVLLAALTAGAYFYLKSKLPGDGDTGLFGLFSQSVPKETNILLMGVDKGGYRSDFMMVANYNTETKEVHTIQIPRDTYVPGNGRKDKKINSAYFSGFEQTKYELNLALGIDVQKYVAVDTEGFRKLVDAIGGVDFEVPFDMNYEDPTQDLYIHLKAGMQHLDGDKAEQFVRWRKNADGSGPYGGSDLGRMDAQKDFLLAVVEQTLQLKNVVKIPELLNILEENVETNLTQGEMMAYATEFMSNLSVENVHFHVLPGESRYFNSLWYFLPDETEAKTLIDQYFYGKKTKPAKPASVDKVPEKEMPQQEDDPPEISPTPIKRTPEPTQTPVEEEPEETEKPAETVKPHETEEPEEPKETKKPAATETPSVSATPQPTADIPTATPQETEAPTEEQPEIEREAA